MGAAVFGGEDEVDVGCSERLGHVAVPARSQRPKSIFPLPSPQLNLASPMNSTPEGGGLNRRKLLQSLAGIGATAALSGCSTLRAARSGSVSNIIASENSRPGTTDWRITNTRVDTASKYRCPWIE